MTVINECEKKLIKDGKIKCGKAKTLIQSTAELLTYIRKMQL